MTHAAPAHCVEWAASGRPILVWPVGSGRVDGLYADSSRRPWASA
jgi:hypothetical protein